MQTAQQLIIPGCDSRAQSPPDWQEILTYFRGSELQNYFTRILEDDLKAVIKPQYVDHIPRAVRWAQPVPAHVLDSVATSRRQCFDVQHLVVWPEKRRGRVIWQRGNVGEVLASKDDRGAIAQLARDLDLEQVRTASISDLTLLRNLPKFTH